MLRSLYRALKRLVDFLWSLLGIIALSPLFLLMAVLIKLDSPGPVFYTHPRVGKQGKPFKVYKFRTMVQGARKKIQKGAKERSVTTRVGRFLRDIYFDEFGQLINVFKGDMAVIGPRAIDVEFHQHAQNFEGKHWNDRLKVKPGMTGLGQLLNYMPRQKERLIDMLPKHRGLEKKYGYIPFDIYYIKHENPLLDIWILFGTFFLVLAKVFQHLSGVPLVGKPEFGE